ncbi:APC family permease [Mucilaginibacter sp. KACC 22063]|uniref:APC family permease n=1 Tax=Mucilaginibacter sp. KACC 22063 TaxID=3025666 RepID=UPI002366BE88|nr:amino acid permease [Mucilaginibacter sp. KACC 22063]WDF54421.1 amino acid permease [Mucilaginibacter sp. KACC 22063]
MNISPKLTRLDMSMIMISLVIGMGIFATPAEVAGYLNQPYTYFAAWFIGGVVSFCGALTFAEIGSAYPSTGGFYKVFSFCFHPAFAFMINWILVISNAMSVAAITIIGAQYISPFVIPHHIAYNTGIRLITITSVLALYLLNLKGIKASAKTQNVLTVFKIALILVISLAVFKTDVHITAPAQSLNQLNPINSLGLSMVAIFFAYGGYQQTINFGGDVINARQNLPKAIFTGMLVVIALYMIINYAYISVLGIENLKLKPALAATMAGVLLGSAGYKIVSVLMFTSVLAYVNVNILANPRVYYAMAEDGILPNIFKRINKRTQVQEFGLSFFVFAIILVLIFIDSFKKVLSYVMFFDTIGLSLSALCIFILRAKQKNSDNIPGVFRIKWYPLVPLIFIICYWAVTVVIFIEHPVGALICLSSFLVGLIIYYFTKRNQKVITLHN